MNQLIFVIYINHQLSETLFKSFVSFIKNPDRIFR